jgi:hypothetical protein
VIGQMYGVSFGAVRDLAYTTLPVTSEAKASAAHRNLRILVSLREWVLSCILEVGHQLSHLLTDEVLSRFPDVLR